MCDICVIPQSSYILYKRRHKSCTGQLMKGHLFTLRVSTEKTTTVPWLLRFWAVKWSNSFRMDEQKKPHEVKDATCSCKNWTNSSPCRTPNDTELITSITTAYRIHKRFTNLTTKQKVTCQLSSYETEPVN